MGRRIGIPEEELNKIHDSEGDDFQHRQRCWEVYLNSHPVPSWKRVATVLYMEGYLKELELVQKFLKGERATIIMKISQICGRGLMPWAIY